MVHTHCNCRDCGQQMEIFVQANSPRVGGSMQYVTCKNPACLLRTVTREINAYLKMDESELESYRKMNRQNQVNV